ncbi:hypothetical protein LshimejAT787_1600300 [Lyophyllum shimeji]|uniref:Uncharacterized protein n=1 Tax=Lyophyllum shimeji TaxID=47721 RepID=A0A9P3PW71_LYOSH|nr:hypothetical protein LshimejAT787_1600300 [Lyophyllum shimeji]
MNMAMFEIARCATLENLLDLDLVLDVNQESTTTHRIKLDPSNDAKGAWSDMQPLEARCFARQYSRCPDLWRKIVRAGRLIEVNHFVEVSGNAAVEAHMAATGEHGSASHHESRTRRSVR